MYIVKLEPKAVKDLAELKKSGNKSVITKIARLLLELAEHPTTGTGQVEALKDNLAGFWSRRIDKFNRLLFYRGRYYNSNCNFSEGPL